jgi:predicted ABC-type transport system involved in lysophospholipase L1 biosynthesis ATPase subunit
VKWLADDTARRACLAEQPHASVISADMPLRANLTAIENIAVVPQYTRNLTYRDAMDVAWNLLLEAGHTECAYKRDPALSHEERFVVKLLRALVGQPALIIVERPALLLPDTRYPPFVDALLQRMAPHLHECWLLDYTWNEPLYAPR